MSGPLIVAAEFAPADFAWLDSQRRAHFPPQRNVHPAHLTLFHALPPSVEAELKALLATLVRRAPPPATVSGLVNLGRGVAYRVRSPGLEEIRATIAERFHGMLSAQDQAGWRPHVTIQNKVTPAEARALLAALEEDFRPRDLGLAGLALHSYEGGPWRLVARYPFRP